MTNEGVELDAVTGLIRREQFHSIVEQQINQTPAVPSRSAFLLIDIDRFSGMNRALGFQEADAVLASTAQLIQTRLRGTECLARHDGARFALWMPSADQRVEVLQLAQRLVEILNVTVSNGTVIPISLSVGCALYPEHGTDIVTLLSSAMRALSEAKNAGGACVRIAGHKVDLKAPNEWAVQNAFANALAQDNNSLALAYQPVVDTVTRRMVGVEALLRTRIRAFAGFSTEAIMDTAEALPVIASLTEWGIDEACVQAAYWNSLSSQRLSVAVNLPPQVLEDKRLELWITKSIAKAKIDASQLTLEVTERALSGNTALAASRLQALAALGCSIAIDDFGVGYAALAQLIHLPANKVKFDRTLLLGAVNSPRGKILFANMLRTCAELGLQVIAEGVETAAQAQLLLEQHCKFAQGYWYARPQDASGIAQLIQADLPLPHAT